MNKLVIVERWEEVVINVTEAQVRDENDEIICSKKLLKKDVEIVDGADNNVYSLEEYNNIHPEIKDYVTDIANAIFQKTTTEQFNVNKVNEIMNHFKKE